MSSSSTYSEANIRSLDWREHIRIRPGMYIGKTGNGNSPDDGIYVLLKEVIDNSVDEYVMGHGRRIDMEIEEQLGRVCVRDYGRGIPIGKLMDCVARINTGGKYDSIAFDKSVGLNGVGIKAVNALSAHFEITTWRDGKSKTLCFEYGELKQEKEEAQGQKKAGTQVIFTPDKAIFEDFCFDKEHYERQLWYYAFLNKGLCIRCNETEYAASRGLLDLLGQEKKDFKLAYPIVHLQAQDIELAFTHLEHESSESYYTFVNGQHTLHGGTHLAAFKEGFLKRLRHFYKKEWEASDTRSGLVAALSIRMREPTFESQTKTKLGSLRLTPNGPSIRAFVHDFLNTRLDNYLHQNARVAEAMQKKILDNQRFRRELAGVKKVAQERAKKATLHNRKLRDSLIHYTDLRKEDYAKTTLFITEGNSASGSITKSRNARTQAVFSLRGKPLNSFGMTKRVVYENEEFNLLQHALNIEAGIEKLRYNYIVIATDADVDGMHIRLLMLTFFFQFYPELVQRNHLYVLETPLFRVRNKKETCYCYTDSEKDQQAKRMGQSCEITRFKGLGEISPNEFGQFIGDKMRLNPIQWPKKRHSPQPILDFYMGKNTPERQRFITENLVVEPTN